MSSALYEHEQPTTSTVLAPQRGVVQGHDTIEIDAPIEHVWPLIGDSKRLEEWGPPVKRVDVLSREPASPSPTGETIGDASHSVPEGLGTWRRVYARIGKKDGWLLEQRVEHVEGRKVGYHITADSFGMGKMLRDVGFSMELEPLGASRTRFVFTFFQRPHGLLGWLMNPLIRLQQGRNRRAALVAVKAFAESR